MYQVPQAQQAPRKPWTREATQEGETKQFMLLATLRNDNRQEGPPQRRTERL